MKDKDKDPRFIEMAEYLKSIGGLENGHFINRPPIDDPHFMSIGLGWYPLVKSLIQELIELGWNKQICQVKEKFGCYDEKTEVLTKSGWKYFKDVTTRDLIATLKDGEYLEYNNPTDIISYKYDGLMYKIKTRGVNLLVTPNHNLYVAKGSYYNGKYKPPKRVDYDFELSTYTKFFNKNKAFKKDAKWIGCKQDVFELPAYENFWPNNFGFTNKICPEKIIDMESWLNFLGWFVAEGCSNSNNGEVAIAYNYKNELEINDVNEAIENIEFKFKAYKDYGISKIYSKQLAIWLSENCGIHAENKKVPNFIKELPPEQILIFLNSLYRGDGHKSKTAHTLYTVSKKLSDDVQELLLKSGFSSKYYVRAARKNKNINGKFNCYCINWLKKSNIHNTANKGLSPSSEEGLVDYNGSVYCLSVPNHVMMVRREGIPVWCGNSLRFYVNGTSEEMDDAIDRAERKSYTICEVCGEKGKKRNGGWILTLCDEHNKLDEEGTL